MRLIQSLQEYKIITNVIGLHESTLEHAENGKKAFPIKHTYMKEVGQHPSIVGHPKTEWWVTWS